MTDNETIKALEERIKELKEDYKRLQLLDAPMDCFEESHIDNIRILSSVLDLINSYRKLLKEKSEKITIQMGCIEWQAKEINRQKAEIERLEHKCKMIQMSRSLLETEKAQAIKHTKIVTIKEFSERLKERIHIKEIRDVYGKRIDNLVKEMVGDV